jgi:hypothetical protein
MNKVVIEVDRVEESCRPEFGRQAKAVKQGANLDGKCVVLLLCSTVLGGAVGTGWLHDIATTVHHGSGENGTPTQLTTLIATNNPFELPKFHKNAVQIAIGGSYSPSEMPKSVWMHCQ